MNATGPPRIETTIVVTPEGSSMTTLTRGYTVEDYDACVLASLTHAVMNAARDSPLGFEKFLERLCEQATVIASLTRRAT